jgi:hypothetical protein
MRIEDLDPDQYLVVVSAGEEGLLWEVLADREPDIARRPAVLAAMARAVEAVVAMGLVRLVPVQGWQPVEHTGTAPPARELLAVPEHWRHDSGVGVQLYLTDEGCRLLGIP